MTAEWITYVLEIILIIFAILILCVLAHAIVCNIWESHKLRKLIRTWEDDKVCLIDHHISKDPIGIGDPHSDTIEKSFSKNDFRYSDEYWKYTFVDGESEKSNHPLSNEELKPLVDIHGPVKPEGLEVIKL